MIKKINTLVENFKSLIYGSIFACAMLGTTLGGIKAIEESKDYVRYGQNQVQVRETYGIENPVIFTRSDNGDEIYSTAKNVRMYDSNLDGRIDYLVINGKTIKRTDQTEPEFRKADEKLQKYFKEMGLEEVVRNWDYYKANGITLDEIEQVIDRF